MKKPTMMMKMERPKRPKRKGLPKRHPPGRFPPPLKPLAEPQQVPSNRKASRRSPDARAERGRSDAAA